MRLATRAPALQILHTKQPLDCKPFYFYIFSVWIYPVCDTIKPLYRLTVYYLKPVDAHVDQNPRYMKNVLKACLTNITKSVLTCHGY